MVSNDDEKPPTPNAGPKIIKGLVTLQPVKYTKDDVSLGQDTVTAEVELRSTSSAAMREGLDLVVVLDTGDDMVGRRIEEVKKALQFVVMKLTPVDRLSIVTFSDEVNRLCRLRSMTQAAKDELKDIIDGLEAGGEPNFLTGLQTGMRVIKRRGYKEGRTANIFLVSAGPCGEATMMGVELFDTGSVPVYTFGLGNGKDPSKIHRLLFEMSTKSLGGTFNWVPDSASLTAAFSQTLAGLLTVVAQDVEVTITPRTMGDPQARDLENMTVVAGDHGEYEPTTDSDTGAITVKFGTLFSGESRKVIIDLTLSRSAVEKTRYDAELADVQHSYTAQGIVQGRRAPQLVQVRRSPNPTGNKGSSSRARQLQAELARRQQTATVFEAWLFVDLGLGPRGLDQARYKLVAAQNTLEDILLDNGKEMVGMLRAELRPLLALMLMKKIEDYHAKGVPYVFASKTSHVKQRFAARGDDINAIRLYSTPRMDTYLQQARQFEKDPNRLLPTADEDTKSEAALRSQP
ncbi:unnamed protein product [Urochloa humidicola]